jgi:hypothetical protein
MSKYDPVTDYQLKLLAKLGYQGVLPTTQCEAWALIGFLPPLPAKPPTKCQLKQLQAFGHDAPVLDRNEATDLLARYKEVHNQKMADDCKAIGRRIGLC